MESFAIILLLMMLGKNADELKESFLSALSFYRENRELFALLQPSAERGNAPKQDPPQAPAEEQEKSRSEETGNRNILEDFLKNRF